jgi:hypothetical protein
MLLIGSQDQFDEDYLQKRAVLPMAPSYKYERGVRIGTHLKLKLKLILLFSSIG